MSLSSFGILSLFSHNLANYIQDLEETRNFKAVSARARQHFESWTQTLLDNGLLEYRNIHSHGSDYELSFRTKESNITYSFTSKPSTEYMGLHIQHTIEVK